MDALASVGVNPDLPRDTLTTALLQSSSEDDLRDMRVKLFKIAREKGLAHPKDILVKRLKRAVGPSLGTKYAIDIADLCYALRNEQLVPRTLLKNGKRSAAPFIAARSRVSSSPQTSDNALPSTASIDGTTRGSHDSVSHNCSENNENNRAITTLTRELGTLRREVTQLKSDIVSLKSSSYDTCCIYVRLKSPISSDLSESLLSSILQCSIACYATIRSRPMLSIRVRILRHHLHTALTSTDKRLHSVRLWKPNQPSTTPSPNPTNPTGNVEVPCCPASAQTPAPTTLTLTA